MGHKYDSHGPAPTGKDKTAWAKEYDQRKAAGAPTRRMRLGESQIQDDRGNWFRRNGQGCCGCGRDAQAHDDEQHMKPPMFRGASYAAKEKGKGS